ncbi:MAG TPA: hypothetical protein VFD49_14635 [Candidatus Dormibacteraeota bacterium]|nr:hypothetical protein [Candidatus Dormibacteraeota bacterium]
MNFQPRSSGQPRNLSAGRDPGCSMCRAAREAEGRHLRWFLLENYGSPSALQRLEGRSYCLRHARRLAAGDNRQLSVTFEYLVRVEQRRLAELAGGGRRRAREARQAATSIECPACVAGLVAARAESSRMLQRLATEAGREAYAGREGPCREHLWWLLGEASEELAAWLLERARERMAALSAGLERYFHRLDHRFHHEPAGEEQTAWHRALRYFWGDVDALAPWPEPPPGRGAVGP